MYNKKFKFMILASLLLMSLSFIGCKSNDTKLAEQLTSGTGTWLIYEGDDDFNIKNDRTKTAAIHFGKDNIMKLYENINTDKNNKDDLFGDYKIKNNVINITDPVGNLMGTNTKVGDTLITIEVKSIKGNTMNTIFNMNNHSVNIVLRKQAEE